MRVVPRALMVFLCVLVPGGALPAPAPAPGYDLLLRGGHMIDSRNGINGIRDVAVSAGKIAAVAQ